MNDDEPAILMFMQENNALVKAKVQVISKELKKIRGTSTNGASNYMTGHRDKFEKIGKNGERRGEVW